MKHLKLFFALFAMLALGVGNAWAEEVSIDFSQKSYSNQQAITDVTITEGINANFDKGTNSNPPKYYTSGEAIRAYGGNTFTISSTIGNITQIDLTFGSSDGSNAITTDAGDFSSSTWTGDANSVKFTIGGTSGNRRIKAIKVTYTPSTGGGETPGEGGGEALSYTWDLTTNSYSAASADLVTWSSTDVNMVVDKDNSSTNANNYLPTAKTSSRFYKNSILTITPEANVTITSVVFTATGTSYASALQGSTWTNASASVSSTTVTVTPTNGASAISATIGGTCGFTGVTVHYTKATSGEPEPVIVKTLKSIAVTGMKTTYEQGDIFKFNGTCTATYSVTKDGVAQADETAEVTPTSVSTPNMNTVGTQTITVTYETVSTTYDITITENEVTPGTYNVLLDNVLWNVASGQQTASVESMSGKANDITFYTTKGSSQMYANATQTRFYQDQTFTISVPEGYLIKSITFAEPESDKKWGGSITVNTGTYTDGTKTWTGSAQEVTYTFGAQNRIANAEITYEVAPVEPTKTLTSIEITTPATQTTFWQGETFNYNGLVVTAHYSDAADEVVTPTVTGSTATAGTATVNVSYKEQSTSYTITVKAIPNTKETAYSVADAYDIIDKLGTASGVFISGTISQVDSYNDQYKSITYWISADGTTTKQLQVYSGKGLESADFSGETDLSVGDQVIVCGNLKKHTDGTYEFNYDNYLVEHTKTTKADPELSYTTTEYNVNLGEAFTAPTLNNTHNLTVTYSSNNEDVATVAADGAVTIKAAGTVKITASFAGNDDYVAGSASYTINITDPNQLEVTFDATQDLDDNNATKGAGKLTKTPITFACTDGILGSSTYGHYRIYANAKATFSAAEGYIITKVVLISTASGTSDYGPAKLSTEDGTYTYSGKEGTWVGEAYTVTLTASAQTRATLITVYYKQDNRVDAVLAWNPATVSLTVGDVFTPPTFTNSNNVTGIEFTSSNDALAIVSNAGVITLKDGVAGKATITALFKGNENYKPAKVTCTITVDHKSEDVVILAKCKDQYYALVAEYVTDKTDVLKALPVEYVGGKIYNVETEDQASIIWKRVVVDGKTTFKNGENYLSAVNSAALNLATEACEWVFEGDMYKVEAGSTRTILYYTSTGGFKNYATTNMSKDGVNGEYSSAAITVAPVFADGDAYHRTVTKDNYGTLCIPFGSNVGNYSGAEFYEISWMEMDGTTPKGIWLDQVNGALTAGKPYIFKATADEIAIVGNGTTATAPAAGVAGLVGTFALIQDSETSGDASNKLEGNYMISGNQFLLCPAGCWLNANRAYIDATIIANHTTKKAEIPGRRRVCLGETSENEATGFENIVAPEGQAVKAIVNGQLIIIRDGVKYNVQGQKL